MSYNPATDFLALSRSTASGVALTRAPGLDIIVDALARANLFTLHAGQTAPTANQASTVWLQPAQPSWSAEGTVWLWDADTQQYVTATPDLWSTVLAASASVTPAAASTLVFETVAQAQAAIIPAAQVSFLVIRFAPGFEAATATYVPGTAAGPNAFQDAGGRWWQLDLTPAAHYASWYGVNGDGGDYHAQLQSAVSFSNGMVVRLPVGVVGCSLPITYVVAVEGAPALRLEGAGGAGQTVVDNRCTGGPAGLIQIHGQPNIFGFNGLVRGIEFITTTRSPVPYVDIYACYRLLVEDCQFIGNLGNGATISGSLGDADASNTIAFKRCQFIGNVGAGLLHNFAPTVVQTSFVRLEDCLFSENGLTGWFCVGLSHSMVNCTFTENGSGVGGTGGLWVANNGGGNAQFTAINCTFENNYVASARLEQLSGGEFINCEVAGGSAGIISALGFNCIGANKVRFEGTRVRIGAVLNPHTAFSFATGSANNVISNTTWTTFDAAGQVRFAADNTSYGNRLDDSFSAVQEGQDNGVMSITFASGANQNVATPNTGTSFSVGGPTGAFNVGGFTKGWPGRRLRLINGTGFTLTLNNEDAGSTAANRIWCGAGGKTVVNQSGVTLEYNANISRWVTV